MSKYLSLESKFFVEWYESGSTQQPWLCCPVYSLTAHGKFTYAFVPSPNELILEDICGEVSCKVHTHFSCTFLISQCSSALSHCLKFNFKNLSMLLAPGGWRLRSSDFSFSGVSLFSIVQNNLCWAFHGLLLNFRWFLRRERTLI